jgi:hypothetical protein
LKRDALARERKPTVALRGVDADASVLVAARDNAARGRSSPTWFSSPADSRRRGPGIPAPASSRPTRRTACASKIATARVP